MLRKLLTLCLSLGITGLISLSSISSAQAETNRIELNTELDLTVMTYNILYTTVKVKECAPRKYLNWSYRGPKVAEWVNFETPDIVGFQENNVKKNRGQLNSIRNRMPDYTFIGANAWKNPIGYKTEKFKLIDSDYGRLSRKGKNFSISNRFVGYVLLREKDTGKKIYVFNTHLNHLHSEKAKKARKLQTEKLISYINLKTPSDSKKIVYVLGDFNQDSAGSENTSENALNKIGLVDSYKTTSSVESSVPGASSYNGMSDNLGGRCTFGAVNTGNNSHIDYVYTNQKESNSAVASWAVSSGPNLRKNGNTYYFDSGAVPSDHSPVVASFSIPVKVMVKVKKETYKIPGAISSNAVEETIEEKSVVNKSSMAPRIYDAQVLAQRIFR